MVIVFQVMYFVWFICDVNAHDLIGFFMKIQVNNLF